ncbi:MAG: hypothetical protein ACLQDM_10585, partial [Bradyrhizobium sp.]
IAIFVDNSVQSSGHSCCRASNPPLRRFNQRISELAQLRGANGSRECAPDDRLRDEATILPLRGEMDCFANARNDGLAV